jgi:hypothetical protein
VSEDVQYVQRVSRFRSVGQKYWFDLLIALLAISAMLEVVVGRDSPGAPSTTLWFCLPAIVILVLGPPPATDSDTGWSGFVNASRSTAAR